MKTRTIADHCHQFSIVALVLYLSQANARVHAPKCTNTQNTHMQNNFTECTGKMTSQYQTNLEGATKLDKEDATCRLFEKILNDCSKMFELCHSPDDISKMKEMQLEALIVQYVDTGEVHLEDCHLVNQYWENQEDTEEGSSEGETCSDKKYIQTQTKFQTCSHEISTFVYQTFYEVTDPDIIMKSVCDALTNISISCPSILKECFPPDDISQMLAMHLKEIKGYLIKLSNVDVDENSFDSCSALSDLPVIEYEEYDEAYYDDDENGDEDEAEDAKDEGNNSQSVQDLLTQHKAQQPADQPSADSIDDKGEVMSPTKQPQLVVHGAKSKTAVVGGSESLSGSNGGETSFLSYFACLTSVLLLIIQR